MAERIATVLESTTQPPVFAVGLFHWILGENNLEVLLSKEGYTLQRVEGMYDPSLTGVSIEECRSEEDVHSNLADPLFSSSATPSDVPVSGPTAQPDSPSVAPTEAPVSGPTVQPGAPSVAPTDAPFSAENSSAVSVSRLTRISGSIALLLLVALV
jgi:hypothetical protein